MAPQNESHPCKRFHIVLVPGFGGFDALGQVEYYSGVTRIFQQWTDGVPAVLHYFDNLPSAAVATRAARLRSYLAKRIARGEIHKQDEILLVGHSTGGLDIRQLLWDLSNRVNRRVNVDGGTSVDATLIRDCIKRVVFLSVPHWGTNIADFVHSHATYRKAVIAGLRASVAGAEVYVVDEIESRLTGMAANLTGANILRAMRDAATEANEHYGTPSPQRTAAAYEAAAQLGLYLRCMGSDFSVMDDLTSRRPADGPSSPAHFDRAERESEFEIWEDPKVGVLSFATLGSCPFDFRPNAPAPLWDLANLLTYPEIARNPQLSEGTDMAYRFCYRACAGGPFRWPEQAGKLSFCLDGSAPPPLEVWDNDGIVNTASMLWPRGDVVLVYGDHLDIVGHYKLVHAASGRGREYQTYDALKCDPHFTDRMFRQVWTEIFNFCVGHGGPKHASELEPEKEVFATA